MVLQGVYIPRVFCKLYVSVKEEKRGKEEAYELIGRLARLVPNHDLWQTLSVHLDFVSERHASLQRARQVTGLIVPEQLSYDHQLSLVCLFRVTKTKKKAHLTFSKDPSLTFKSSILFSATSNLYRGQTTQSTDSRVNSGQCCLLSQVHTPSRTSMSGLHFSQYTLPR